MSIIEKTVYITRTGEQFDTRAEAEFEEKAWELGAAIEDQIGVVYGTDARAVARWILERYELRPDREAP
jgi:hypothetical protein